MMGSIEEMNVDVSALSLPNAYDEIVNITDFKGKVVVLAGGGQKTIEESKKWGGALAEACAEEDELQYYGVGFLKGLPAFVPKLMVKSNVKNGPPSMLDWDGTGAEILGLTRPDMMHIYLVDKQSVLRWRLIASYSRDALNSVLEQAKLLAQE